MLNRPSRIDRLTIGDHHLLTCHDEVYYFGEYTAREGYDYSPTNQLIINLKHGVEHRGKSRWHYKERAMDEVAESLAKYIDANFASVATFVPIPPSAAPSDPEYDSRNLDVLMRFRKRRPSADVRSLLFQTASTRKSHRCEDRLTVGELVNVYQVDGSLASPAPRTIVLFDDVLTTGTHFVAARTVLRTKFANARYIGLMVARRKPQPFDFKALPEP